MLNNMIMYSFKDNSCTYAHCIVILLQTKTDTTACRISVLRSTVCSMANSNADKKK